MEWLVFCLVLFAALMAVPGYAWKICIFVFALAVFTLVPECPPEQQGNNGCTKAATKK